MIDPIIQMTSIQGLKNMAAQLDTELARKMIDRANADGLPIGHELRTKAMLFENAAKGYWADPQTVPVQSFMGIWARARRAWCNYTGEPLI